MRRFLAVLCFLLMSLAAWSADSAISGTVTDSVGAVVRGATVTLVQNGKDLATTKTDDDGKFQFSIDSAGRYSLRTEAKTFATTSSKEIFAEPGHSVELSMVVSPSVVTQNIVVTATRCAYSGGPDGNLRQCHRKHYP